METTKQFQFRVRSFRTIPDPTAKDGHSRYIAVVHAAELPEDIPMDTNPRDQALGKKVPRKIRESFLGVDTGDLFYLLNRGLLISAEKVHFNNKTSELTVVMSDFEKHGLLDGGHTYRITCENRDETEYDQYLTLEILTGVEDDFAGIVEARNTSMQVSETALMELRKDTRPIKKMLAGLPFAENIAYRENEEKDVDVREVVALVCMFNLALWEEGEQPTACYSGKAATLDRYNRHRESFDRVNPLAPYIFGLYDHIKGTMADLYWGKDQVGRGRLGARKEFGGTGSPLYFSFTQEELATKEKRFMTKHDIPTGFTYPILGAMRALVEYDEDNDEYSWDCPDGDPIAFYDEHVGAKLVNDTLDVSMRQGQNPSAVGKDRHLWQSLYNVVRLKKMEMDTESKQGATS